VQAFIDENVIATAGGFICRPCNKFIKHKISIKRHAEQSHINEGMKYQCPLCNSIFKSKNSLSVHTYSKHPELKGMDFDQCAVKRDY
jgi:uncharacterized C2H2 Zn-finger protein